MEPELFDVLITIRTTTKQKERVDSLRGDKTRSEFIRGVLDVGMSSHETIEAAHQSILEELEYLRTLDYVKVQNLAQAENITPKAASRLLQRLGWKICSSESRANKKFKRGDLK